MREFSAVSGLPVELRVDGTERTVPPAVGSALYRITQEALANVFRHADAKSIEARSAFNGNGLSLEIRDDGQRLRRRTEVTRLDGTRPAQHLSTRVGGRRRRGNTEHAGPWHDGPGQFAAWR